MEMVLKYKFQKWNIASAKVKHAIDLAVFYVTKLIENHILKLFLFLEWITGIKATTTGGRKHQNPAGWAQEV